MLLKTLPSFAIYLRPSKSSKQRHKSNLRRVEWITFRHFKLDGAPLTTCKKEKIVAKFAFEMVAAQSHIHLLDFSRSSQKAREILDAGEGLVCRAKWELFTVLAT